MRAADARESFERFLAENRIALAGVGALVALVDWAGAEPADDFTEDLLLYQWGTRDWTPGVFEFECSVTRQVTLDGAGGTWQLGLTLKVPESDATHALGEGSFWNDEAPDRGAFREFVERGPASEFFRTVAAPGARLKYETA